MRGHRRQRTALRSRRAAAALAAALAIAASGCGGDGGGGGATESDGLGPIPPAPEAVAQAQDAVRRYCAKAAAFARGRRGPPTFDEYERAGRAIDRLAERAKLSPTDRLPDGRTPRIALSELAEKVDRRGCSPRLVARIDDLLTELPAV